MSRPIRCTGHGDCRQGRAPCRTPLTCSGMPVDQAIERFNRERTARPARPITFAEPEPVESSLLASPAFWWFGAACLAAWAALGWMVLS